MNEFKWVFGNFDSFFGYEENPPDKDKDVIMLIDEEFAKRNSMSRLLIGKYNLSEFVAQSININERHHIKPKRVIAWSYLPGIEK